MLKLTKVEHLSAAGRFWVRAGRLHGHEVLLTANGVGRNRAAAAADAGCSLFKPDAVVSTGFCGALDPNLSIATVLVGTCVRGGGTFVCQPVLADRPYTRGVVMSVDHVVQTANEKHALHSRGASVVEMEAGGVAARAEALGLPFYCVRAVTDLAGEDLANNFNQALREDGQFDTMRIFGHSLSRPVARISELFRLRGNCIRAAQALGDFFANCQF